MPRSSAPHGENGLKPDITSVLLALSEGQPEAFDTLVSLVYSELRRVARNQLRQNRPGDILQTTALVHELYLKLFDQKRVTWKNRSHFFAICARAMRQILVDHARKRRAQKRGDGHPAETYEDSAQPGFLDADSLIALSDALETLKQLDEKLVGVVECRFFAGYSEEETAEALGISLRSTQRYWSKARGLLRSELQ